MKTKLLWLALFAGISCYGQIPNVRENKSAVSSEQNKANIIFTIDRSVLPDSLKKSLMDNFVETSIPGNYQIKSNFSISKSVMELINKSNFTSDTVTPFLKNYHRINRQKVIDDIKDFEIEAGRPANNDRVKLLLLEEKIKRKKTLLKNYDTLFENIRNMEKFSKSFPSSRSKEDKERFFSALYNKKDANDIYFVNSASLQFNDEGSTIQSEITSAYLWAFRLSFGTLVSNSDNEDDTDEEAPDTTETTHTEAFQRLLSNAGNVFLNAEYPMFYDETNLTIVYFNAFGKGAVDISEFSNDVDTSTGNGSFGGNLYASVSTDKNEFNFFVNASYAWYLGSDQFYERLQIADSKPFGFGQVTLGFTVLNRLRLSFTTNTFSSEENLRSGNILFGVQILSGLFEK